MAASGLRAVRPPHREPQQAFSQPQTDRPASSSARDPGAQPVKLRTVRQLDSAVANAHSGASSVGRQEGTGHSKAASLPPASAACSEQERDGLPSKRKRLAQPLQAQQEAHCSETGPALSLAGGLPRLHSLTGLLQPRGPPSGSSSLAGNLPDPAPATTVMEAQESGERLEVQDQALYALDGLTPACSTATQRHSAVALASICALRRNRSALRADGLLTELLTAGQQLPLDSEPVLALALSFILLMLSQDKVTPPLFATAPAAKLAARLLQVLPGNLDGQEGTSLQQLIQERSLPKSLPDSEAMCPASLVLHAVASTADVQHSGASDSLKSVLRSEGLLEQMCRLLAESADSFRAPPHNSSRSHALSVLMNVTHNNATICSQVIEAQGCEVAMAVVGAALSPAAQASPEAGGDRSALIAAVDALSVALGLLINLAESASLAVRATMSSTQASPGQTTIPLLCRLVQAAQPEPESPHGSEITEAALAAREAESAASIVALYASLLTGLLIEGDEGRMRQAEDCFRDHSLRLVAQGVQQCLAFYLRAAAITPRTEASLRRLAASLSSHMPLRL
ncbi:hypothetical protein WJX73_008214 [Symbiochloris irregularis]|uniref:Wings apart-like protein C-terminal domain-containing protein n=1 Tax=Symbiochloris irregularis TaxID=706552 RepID=A0AAW1NLM0_9CHLO